jgi:hypothetical protein
MKCSRGAGNRPSGHWAESAILDSGPLSVPRSLGFVILPILGRMQGYIGLDDTDELECWYEIHEWIPPANARANVGVWAPVCVRDGAGLQVWREENLELAESQFQVVDPNRRFRLVLVSRKVVGIRGQ